MKTNLPALALATAAFLSGTAALATATPTRTTAVKQAVATHTVVTKTPMKAPVTTAAVSTHMVTTKTRTGKTITYNCAKAGNATKAACKKGA